MRPRPELSLHEVLQPDLDHMEARAGVVGVVVFAEIVKGLGGKGTTMGRVYPGVAPRIVRRPGQHPRARPRNAPDLLENRQGVRKMLQYMVEVDLVGPALRQRIWSLFEVVDQVDAG